MIDMRSLQREHEISGESAEDAALLKYFASEARSYIGSFAWSRPIKELYLACGVGGVVGLFLLEFEQPLQSGDKFLWVIVGDLPSAYLVAELQTPREAITEYVVLMENWADAVKGGRPLNTEYPVRAPATVENANLLLRRTKLIKKYIMASK